MKGVAIGLLALVLLEVWWHIGIEVLRRIRGLSRKEFNAILDRHLYLSGLIVVLGWPVALYIDRKERRKEQKP